MGNLDYTYFDIPYLKNQQAITKNQRGQIKGGTNQRGQTRLNFFSYLLTKKPIISLIFP